ncbi:MAG: hypothetical protein ACOC8F_01695 [Planctomycetota bacterium]
MAGAAQQVGMVLVGENNDDILAVFPVRGFLMVLSPLTVRHERRFTGEVQHGFHIARGQRLDKLHWQVPLAAALPGTVSGDLFTKRVGALKKPPFRPSVKRRCPGTGGNDLIRHMGHIKGVNGGEYISARCLAVVARNKCIIRS